MKSKRSKLDIDLCILVIILIQTFSASRIALRHFEVYLLLLGIALCAFKVINNRKLIISFENKIWLLFCGYIALSFLWTYSVFTTRRFLLLLVYAAAVVTAVINRTFIERYIKLVYAGCLIQAISMCIEFIYPSFIVSFFWPLFGSKADLALYKAQERYIGAYSGIIGEKADAAFFMCIGFSILISRCFAKRSFNKSDLLSGILLMIGMLLTGKRMLFLIYMAIPLLLILISDISSKKKVTRIVGIGFAAVIAFAVIIAIIPDLGTVFERFNTNISDDVALNDRYQLWGICLKMFRNSPLLGMGLATFNFYAGSQGVYSSANAHNIYLQLLGETGLVGCTILICFLAFIMVKNINMYRLRKCLNREELAWLYISYCGQFIFLFYGLSGNTFYYWFELTVYLVCILILNNLSFKYSRSQSAQLVRGEQGY